ncbi:MAG: transcription termination factor Rho [Candidatus Eisenbacteria bacterium]|nr:transcription termination factor Rho [Candidatus Eisenbacteria bacterium]
MPLFDAPSSGGESSSPPIERAPSASSGPSDSQDSAGSGGTDAAPDAGGGEGGGGERQGRDGRGRRRRRRQRGGDRPQGAPQQDRGPQLPQQNRGYANNSGGNDRNDRGGRGRRRRGRNDGGGGRGNGGGNNGGGRPMRRGGLEILKDMQQIGAALDPTERLILELPAGAGDPPYGDRITGRAIDLIAPIGRGQRCLIVSPPKAGKTRILQAIAASIAHNHPDVAIYALLVDERPEEVTDFKRNTPAEVIAASSDMSIAEHIETAERAMEVVAQQVIAGKDVVLLLDSITRLARAYNAASGNGGRTMSGGLDSNAMQAPRQIFGSARKIENGGSLTIFGTALIDTGSRMDQVIFEEFKGTGNSEIYLSRELAERRIYPAIDIPKSGTRKEEKLIAPELIGTFQALRRILVQMPAQEAMLKLTDRLGKTKTNEDFFNLVRVGES